MHIYQHSMEELTEDFNRVKEAVIDALGRKNLLRADAEAISARLAVVVHKKNMLGRIWDKVRGHTDNDAMRIAVLADISLEELDGDCEGED